MSHSWDQGYTSDIPYTYGYYRELNPLMAKLLFLNKGLAFPHIPVATACELGFGQGMSINLHAASSPSVWYGTDFLPSQVSFASSIAARYSSASTYLFDNSFEAFAQRDDLPQFDFIGLHGIWSWISHENQRHIVEIIRKHLKVGGIVYISYNTPPGFTPFEPVRQIMHEYWKKFCISDASRTAELDRLTGFLQQLLSVDPAYIRLFPLLKQRVESALTQDKHYLIHEYLNESWEPVHFADLAQALSEAKVDFACSATCLEHVDALNLTPAQQEFLKPYAGTNFYETIRDMLVNQQFRRDYFVKGVRYLTPAEKEQELNSMSFILVVPVKDVSYEVKSSLLSGSLKKEIYEPLLQLLSDNKAHSFRELKEKLQYTSDTLLSCFITLTGCGYTYAAVSEPDSTVTARARKLNRYLLERYLSSGEVTYLASPVLAGGFSASGVDMMYASHVLGHEGKCTEEELVSFGASHLQQRGQSIIKNGQTITDAKLITEELRGSARNFLNFVLPLYKTLQIM